MRVMQNIAHLSLNELCHIFCGHAGLIFCEFRIVPVCANKNRMVSISFQNGFNDIVQNVLLIGKVTVKRCLTDTYCIGELRDTGRFVSVDREQIQRRLQYLFPCAALFHAHRLLSK